MERQRSFQIKPTRFLLFSFTISSSFIFLIFFSIWVLKLSPSFNQEPTFHFSSNSQALTVQNGNNLSEIEVKNSILSVQEGLGKESENIEVADNKGEIFNSNFSFFTQSKTLEKESENIEVAAEDAVNKGDIFKSNFSVLTQSKNLFLDGVESSSLEANNSRVSEDITNFAESFDVEEVKGTSKNLEANYSRKSEDVTNFAERFGVEGVRGVGTGADVHRNFSGSLSEEIRSSIDDEIQKKYGKSCDYGKGMWVFDESYPLYTNVTCPFIDEGFNCLANGRLDKDYMKWRWQPQGCDLPRFNATKMLELIRGKRLVFVGDSVNRNQWESLLCLLMGAIKDPKKVFETRGRRITKGKGNYSFKFVDYKCTVEFYVTHFLVHESKARIGRKRVQTLRIDTIDKGSSRWRAADILVFNTAHWWNHQKTKAGINYYQEKDQVLPRLDVLDAFRRALLTWASWVDKNIRSQRTQVFFRSSAPSHFSGGQWNSGGHCREASRPLDVISDTNYTERNKVVEAIISQMRTPVTYLNITSLSDYRIDGHPSIHGRMPGKSYSSGGEDCSHWCLPGVPDTWNQILYSHLLLKGQKALT